LAITLNERTPQSFRGQGLGRRLRRAAVTVDMPVRLVEIHVRSRPGDKFGQRHAALAAGERLMELTEDDVLEILKLFEQSKFDFLQLEQGERRITVSKSGYKAGLASAGAEAAPVRALSAVGAPPAAPVPPAASAAPEPGLLPVTAPMVGKFYAAPSPSDPPFVMPGAKVAAGATVGLIEVMKVFASIKTEIAGVIERILVANGEFVEFGQTLFWIRPDPQPEP
jgi:acetyl-CoA carboxylase biotin carboxyl carrier protein